MVLARSLLVALSCYQLAFASAPSGWSGTSGWSAGSQDYTSRYSGPIAVPVVLSDGTLANTPEVAAARSQHLVALNKAKALWYGKGGSDYSGHGSSSDGSWPSGGGSSANAWPSSSSSAWPSSSSSAWPSSASSSGWPSSSGSAWTGPQAWPSVLPSGHLADTPSVSAARAAHLGALAQAHQEAEKWKPQGHGWS